MRAALFWTLAGWMAGGCGGTSSAPVPVSPPTATVRSPEARAVAGPETGPVLHPEAGSRRPERPADPPRALRELLRSPISGAPIATELDDPVVHAPAGAVLRRTLPTQRKRDYWSPCVRAFVQGEPAGVRELLGEALDQYGTTCVLEPAPRVDFVVPRPARSGAVAPPESGLVLRGALAPDMDELTLEVHYHGPPIQPERITLIADGVWWSSPRLDFEAGDGGEVAVLPMTRALGRVVRRAIDARDTLLRFERGSAFEDVAVTDERKQELRTMLDALDALGRP